MLNACKNGCALAVENKDISEKTVLIEPALQNRLKKYNGKELHQHIRSLLKDMNDEEIDEFWKESEAQGF